VVPNLNASYALRDNLVARAAFYTSIGRPAYGQYAGGVQLPDESQAPSPNNRIIVSNVSIKPWSAKTTKVSLEYYFERVVWCRSARFAAISKTFSAARSSPRLRVSLAL